MRDGDDLRRRTTAVTAQYVLNNMGPQVELDGATSCKSSCEIAPQSCYGVGWDRHSHGWESEGERAWRLSVARKKETGKASEKDIDRCSA